MIKKVCLALIVAVMVFPVSAGSDEAAVKQTIEEAYVKGIHINRDIPAIRKGFHKDFTMFMNLEGGVKTMSIDAWVERIEQSKEKSPEPPKHKTTHKIPMVSVTGNAAVAQVEIYRDGKQIFTDYMSLYKFDDGWKIIGKIYETHR